MSVIKNEMWKLFILLRCFSSNTENITCKVRSMLALAALNKGVEECLCGCTCKSRELELAGK